MGLTFRQKIFISYLLVLLVITTLLYPVVTNLIEQIQERNLKRRTNELIVHVTKAPNFKNLTERLRQREKFLFFRVSLIDVQNGIIYDSHRQIGGDKPEEFNLDQPEVEKALVKGSGYDVRYSSLFGQEMAYMAVTFFYEGKKYVLRTSFPYGQISDLSRDFTFAFLLLTIGILLLFGLLAWLILHHLTQPIQQITKAIKPYQLGLEEHIPEIRLGKGAADTEFARLAETFNSLSKRIDQQIDTLVQERNEKIAILESLGEGVIAVDRALKVLYVNKMAEMLLGVSKEKLIGQSLVAAGQPQCNELIKEAQERDKTLFSVLKPEGKPKRYLDVIAVPRGIEGTLLVLQDKTSLHKIIELGRDFIANASHELKTPITIIRGFAETLHDHPELSKEVSLEITQKIVTNCQRMDTLVKNLLTLAAVDEGLPRSRMQECDLLDLVESARQTVLTVHGSAQIHVETRGPEPFHLMVDSDLFLQAILNLLDNAVKYSKPPAEVGVMLEKQGDSISISVTDKGIGIPQEDLDRIFERFYAVDKSHSRSMGGSGLGLSIVERIVEKHNGKITVESHMGAGTTFTITLPIREDEMF